MGMKALYVLLALVITFPIATKGFYSKKNLPGILLCLGLSLPAYYIGQAFPMAGGPVVGILLGMIIANFWTYPKELASGIKDSSKRVLQVAIVLFGFQMDLSNVMSIGVQALVLIFATITVSLLLAYFVGKALNIDTNEKILIGIGTAICGGSAIAASAPIIKAKDSEIVRSISTIFLFNVIAAFAFPVIGRIIGMSDLRFGMWAGSAINDTSSVVAAGYAFSDAAGDVATIVKLTRTLMIIPVTFILALRQSKIDQNQDGGFSFFKAFPWFIAAFLLACIINTFGVIPAGMASYWGKMGKYLIIIAMVAIGLSCNLKDLISKGKKPILLGLCCSFSVAAVSIILQSLLGLV